MKNKKTVVFVQNVEFPQQGAIDISHRYMEDSREKFVGNQSIKKDFKLFKI